MISRIVLEIIIFEKSLFTISPPPLFFGGVVGGVTCGSSQARGRIRAAAAGLHHSHCSAESELHLPPTLQLAAMLDP